MKYDFKTIIDRSDMDAIAVGKTNMGTFYKAPKIKEGFSMIPMWVADMNFATVPTIVEAMQERAAHPLYGYFMPRKEYFDSIIHWQETHHGHKGLTSECIGYENGVMGGVTSALRIMASQGDNILMHSPTYVGFTMTLLNNGFHAVDSPLVLDEKGVWRMDFQDMDAKIKANKIHTAIFCSPYNPCGRVWEKWEIEKAMEVYEKNNVNVISDEIWADLTLGDKKHIPTQTVSDYARNHTIAMYAPSKTFNLAGLVGAYHIIYDPWLRDRMEKESSLSHYNSMNVLSMYALIGAYKTEGEEWVEQLREVLTENVYYGYNYIKKHFKGVQVFKAEGTYMLFLDCTEWLKEHGMTSDELFEKARSYGVIWQHGRQFKAPNSMRLNFALPNSQVVEAMDRLDKYVFNA